jgi:hypothetical protein
MFSKIGEQQTVFTPMMGDYSYTQAQRLLEYLVSKTINDVFDKRYWKDLRAKEHDIEDVEEELRKIEESSPNAASNAYNQLLFSFLSEPARHQAAKSRQNILKNRIKIYEDRIKNLAEQKSKKEEKIRASESNFNLEDINNLKQHENSLQNEFIDVNNAINAKIEGFNQLQDELEQTNFEITNEKRKPIPNQETLSKLTEKLDNLNNKLVEARTNLSNDAEYRELNEKRSALETEFNITREQLNKYEKEVTRRKQKLKNITRDESHDKSELENLAQQEEEMRNLQSEDYTNPFHEKWFPKKNEEDKHPDLEKYKQSVLENISRDNYSQKKNNIRNVLNKYIGLGQARGSSLRDKEIGKIARKSEEDLNRLQHEFLYKAYTDELGRKEENRKTQLQEGVAKQAIDLESLNMMKGLEESDYARKEMEKQRIRDIPEHARDINRQDLLNFMQIMSNPHAQVESTSGLLEKSPRTTKNSSAYFGELLRYGARKVGSPLLDRNLARLDKGLARIGVKEGGSISERLREDLPDLLEALLDNRINAPSYNDIREARLKREAAAEAGEFDKSLKIQELMLKKRAQDRAESQEDRMAKQFEHEMAYKYKALAQAEQIAKLNLLKAQNSGNEKAVDQAQHRLTELAIAKKKLVDSYENKEHFWDKWMNGYKSPEDRANEVIAPEIEHVRKKLIPNDVQDLVNMYKSLD